MPVITDLVNPDPNPLPNEVKELVAALLEGRVHSLAIIAEVTKTDGEKDWLQGFSMDMDDNESDDYGFVGTLSMILKRVQDYIEEQDFIIALTEQDDDEDEEGEDAL